MSYFDMILAKKLSGGGGGGGGSLPFAYKKVRWIFTAPEWVDNIHIAANDVIDEQYGAINPYIDIIITDHNEHTIDTYITQLSKLYDEENNEYYAWACYDLYMFTELEDSSTPTLEIDKENSTYEHCHWDSHQEEFIIDDNTTEATVHIVFAPIQS